MSALFPIGFSSLLSVVLPFLAMDGVARPTTLGPFPYGSRGLRPRLGCHDREIAYWMQGVTRAPLSGPGVRFFAPVSTGPQVCAPLRSAAPATVWVGSRRASAQGPRSRPCPARAGRPGLVARKPALPAARGRGPASSQPARLWGLLRRPCRDASGRGGEAAYPAPGGVGYAAFARCMWLRSGQVGFARAGDVVAVVHAGGCARRAIRADCHVEFDMSGNACDPEVGRCLRAGALVGPRWGLRAQFMSAQVDVGLGRGAHAGAEEEAGMRWLVVAAVLPGQGNPVLGVVSQRVQLQVGWCRCGVDAQC